MGHDFKALRDGEIVFIITDYDTGKEVCRFGFMANKGQRFQKEYYMEGSGLGIEER